VKSVCVNAGLPRFKRLQCPLHRAVRAAKHIAFALNTWLLAMRAEASRAISRL
jgi:hypothetical protein